MKRFLSVMTVESAERPYHCRTCPDHDHSAGQRWSCARYHHAHGNNPTAPVEGTSSFTGEQDR